jgi:hypothetical protein
MVVVGRCRTRYLGNVVTNFVAIVGMLVCTLLVLASGTAMCILPVCIGCFHQCLEILFGKHVVGLDGGGLLLPIKHFVLVEVVAAVRLLQVKLEFVFVCNCYIGADERTLVVVEVLPEGSEMLSPIQLGVVRAIQCFLHFDIKGAPAIIQMFQDLEGSDIPVHLEAMLQLGIVLFVEGVT